MLFISRLIAGLLFIFCVGGIVGGIVDGRYLLAIQAIPFVYFFWIVWKVLQPIDTGSFRFFLAHLGPGFVILIGLIFVFAPNKVLEFVVSGVGLICAGGVLIFQMHVQRKVIRALSLAGSELASTIESLSRKPLQAADQIAETQQPKRAD